MALDNLRAVLAAPLQLCVLVAGLGAAYPGLASELLLQDRFECAPCAHPLEVLAEPGLSLAIEASLPSAAGTTPYIIPEVETDQVLVLVAPALAGESAFNEWSGCDYTSDRFCVIVRMDGPRSVQAHFDSTALVIDDLRFNGQPASALTVATGGLLTVSWSTSEPALCTAQGSFPSWSGPVSSPVTRSAAWPGDWTLGLRCETDDGRSAETEVFSIVVEDAPGPAPVGCDDPERGMPANWTRLTTGINACVWNGGIFQSGIDCSFWTRAPGSDPPGIWSAPFWESIGNTRRLATNRRAAREYVAIQIDTTGLPGNYVGTMLRESAGGMFRTARTIYSISECPGDFSEQAVCSNNTAVGIPFGGPDTPRDCALQPGRIYYLNLVASESPVGTPGPDIQPACSFASSSTPCGWVFDISNF